MSEESDNQSPSLEAKPAPSRRRRPRRNPRTRNEAAARSGNHEERAATAETDLAEHPSADRQNDGAQADRETIRALDEQGGTESDAAPAIPAGEMPGMQSGSPDEMATLPNAEGRALTAAA